jgi:acyl-CoA reductase-like NAD-dependent aldehyde dehydrogenase
MRYESFDEVIALHNAAPQGLSSSIFTNDLREAELFLSAAGSDCGIVNVNIGPSAPRSAARSAARRKRAAGARAVPTLAQLHAAGDQHDQLQPRAAARSGHQLLDAVIQDESQR